MTHQIYQLLANKIMMTFLAGYYWTAAIVYSIVALSLVPLILLFFRHYFRGLDLLQMAYYFTLTMASTSFSSQLTVSVVNFNLNFLNFCTTGDFVCSNGFQLSFGAVLGGLLFLIFFFVMLQKCCGKDIRFEPAYLTFKGFIKFIYAPLVFNSTVSLIGQVELWNASSLNLTTFLPPAIVLGVLAVFPFFQLIGYKCIQEEKDNIWRKWMEVLNYYRLGSVCAILGVAKYYQNNAYCNYILIPLIIYFIFYVIKGEYKYRVLERVIYVAGDLAFIALYVLFWMYSSYITDYDLDFFVLGGIMLIDTLLYLVRALKFFCYGADEGSPEINPESGAAVAVDNTPPKKVNKYQHDSGESLQHSRQDLQLQKPPVQKKTRR